MIIGVPPINGPLDIINLLILILLLTIAIFGICMVTFLVFNWIIVNIVRLFRRNNGTNKASGIISIKPCTKLDLDIHIETNDSKLVNSIHNLSDAISQKKDNE